MLFKPFELRQFLCRVYDSLELLFYLAVLHEYLMSHLMQLLLLGVNVSLVYGDIICCCAFGIKLQQITVEFRKLLKDMLKLRFHLHKFRAHLGKRTFFCIESLLTEFFQILEREYKFLHSAYPSLHSNYIYQKL